MVEWTSYKIRYFRPEGGCHVLDQTKYFFDENKGISQYTDDDPVRLFDKMSGLIEPNDKVVSAQGYEINVTGHSVKLKTPLNEQEMELFARRLASRRPIE